MDATIITIFCTEGRDQDAAYRTGRAERSGRDEEAGHSLRIAHLSLWATGTGGPCLPVCPPRTFKSDMIDEDGQHDEGI